MKIKVGNLESMIDKAIKKVIVEDYPILLVRISDRIYAVSATCTHMGCSLEGGEIRGLEIICPCHGARFNLENGESVRPEITKAPLQTFQVEILDGEVYLILPN